MRDRAGLSPERRLVVILSSEDDIHAIAVSDAIRKAYPEFRAITVDGGQFPTQMSLTIADGHWTIMTQTETVSDREVSAVWYRRPKMPRVDPAITDATARKFALNESGIALDFLAQSHDYRVVNRIESHFAANRKPYQLYVARQVGLSVPHYAISNDPRQVKRLIDAYGEENVIFKPLTPPSHIMAETRVLRPEHLAVAEAVRYAPIIFQRRVRRKAEYRVTLIGRTMFVHRLVINSAVVRELPDWRLDPTIESSDATIPTDVEEKLRELMRRLDLEYGAIDLIEDESGDFYFLEVNPQGQFLFNEVDTAAPMSLEFAGLLCGMQGGRESRG